MQLTRMTSEGRDSWGARRRAPMLVSPRMPSEMSATPLPEIRLYTRPGCDLCVEAREALQGLLEDRAALGQPIATVRELDITTDPELERRNFDVIPVVELADRRLELAISPAKLRRFLADALDATTSRIA
jgi:glutaredoxin